MDFAELAGGGGFIFGGLIFFEWVGCNAHANAEMNMCAVTCGVHPCPPPPTQHLRPMGRHRAVERLQL